MHPHAQSGLKITHKRFTRTCPDSMSCMPFPIAEKIAKRPFPMLVRIDSIPTPRAETGDVTAVITVLNTLQPQKNNERATNSTPEKMRNLMIGVQFMIFSFGYCMMINLKVLEY